MSDMTAREAADRVESILRHADLTTTEVEVVRALRDHARATDPAVGDDLAALREWVATVGEGNPCSPTPGHMLNEIDRRLAVAPTPDSDLTALLRARLNEIRTGGMLVDGVNTVRVVRDGREARLSVDDLAAEIASVLVTPTAAWSQHFEDTAEYAGGFTEPERNGIRAAARMMRDSDVRARVHSTTGGTS